MQPSSTRPSSRSHLLRWFRDPIGPYDVLIAEHAMAPNLIASLFGRITIGSGNLVYRAEPLVRDVSGGQ